jgi:hypothetical protein
VRIVLGLLLVTAAGLKLSGLDVTALPRAGWFATPQVQLAAAEWELVLGAWLLSGSAPFAAWLAALGTFLGFAIVSAYFGWIGVASCGCFGAIRTRPWTALAVDVVAISALLICCPRSNLARTLPSRSSAIIPLGVAAILLGLTGIGSGTDQHLLRVEPDPIRFGPVARAGFAAMEIRVHNESQDDLSLVNWTSSCDCLHLAFAEHQIPAGRSTTVRVAIDLSGKPDLHGLMTIAMTLHMIEKRTGRLRELRRVVYAEVQNR